MAIIDRVKNICLSPTTEWPVIAEEASAPGSLISGYVVPLAAIGAVAGLIGGSIIGRTIPFIGTYRVPITAGVAGAIFTFVMAIVGCFVMSLIINALAPSFDGQKNSSQALKVAVYSYTPAWVAGALQILPLLGLLGLLAGLYGLYLLYLGLPRLMKCPENKALGYTAVVVICAIVLSVVIMSAGGLIAGAGLVGSGALSGLSPGTLGGAIASGALGGAASSGALGSNSAATSAASGDVQFDRNSPLGKLQELGNKLEENNKKAEAAQQSGDTGAQVAAAAANLGLIFGGGKHVDPVGIDQLKPFVPDTFLGLTKRSSNAEKNGIAGLMVSKAEATYSDGAGKNVTLEISDTGGASGLLGLASWASLQGEKETDDSFERTTKVNGRLVHEEGSKRPGGRNEFGIVLGERFMVSARGDGVELNDLKAAVSKLDLGKLETMKDVGVQK